MTGLLLFFSLLTPWSTAVPRFGGNIHEGMIGVPQYINPLLSINDSGKGMSKLIYSGLLKETKDGTFEPDLAESYTLSEDKLTYDVYLREGLTFHDKAPLTADDIVFTINKAQDPLIKSPEYANWHGVSVVKVDPLHVQFVLRAPFAPFIKNLTLGILPAHLWQNASIDQFAFSLYNFEPIGSGPYKIKSNERDSAGRLSSYNLEANADYALGRPYIKTILITFYPDENALIKAINKGIVDSAGGISPENVSSIKKNGIEVKNTHLLRIFAVFFSQTNSKTLADKNTRENLMTSVDRSRIVNDVFGGYASSETLPIPSHFLNGRVANNPKPDILKGTSTSAFTLSTANTPELVKTANLLKDMWGKIGINIEVDVKEASTLNQEVIKPRKFEALLFGEVITRELDLYPFWHSSQRNNPGLNISSYTNKTADDSLEEGRRAEDIESKVSAYQNFLKEFEQDIPAIFLYSPNYIYVVPSNLKGLEIDDIENSEERYERLSESFIKTRRILNIFNK